MVVFRKLRCGFNFQPLAFFSVKDTYIGKHNFIVPISLDHDNLVVVREVSSAEAALGELAACGNHFFVLFTLEVEDQGFVEVLA